MFDYKQYIRRIFSLVTESASRFRKGPTQNPKFQEWKLYYSLRLENGVEEQGRTFRVVSDVLRGDGDGHPSSPIHLVWGNGSGQGGFPTSEVSVSRSGSQTVRITRSSDVSCRTHSLWSGTRGVHWLFFPSRRWCSCPPGRSQMTHSSPGLWPKCLGRNIYTLPLSSFRGLLNGRIHKTGSLWRISSTHVHVRTHTDSDVYCLPRPYFPT